MEATVLEYGVYTVVLKTVVILIIIQHDQGGWGFGENTY